MLKSALLLYKKLLSNFMAIGFKINPCDTCVIYKTVYSKQLAILCHVDNHKISHVGHVEITKVEDCLRGTYRKLTVSRGEMHQYLGINLSYRTKGKVNVSMIQ